MRVFIAIGLPGEIKKRLFETGGLVPGRMSRVAEPNLHITLQFLGEIDEDALAKAIGAVRSIKESQFTARIKGISCFKSRGIARVVFANVIDKGNIFSIHNGLSNALAAEGIKTKAENRYTPHITIGRMKSVQKPETDDFINAHSVDEFGSFVASSISVYKSYLSSGGSEYVALYEKKLTFPA